MFKHFVPVNHEVEPTHSRSILPWIISILVAGAVLAPLAAEVVAICYAQWSEILGKSTEPRTPILDSMGRGLQHAGDLLADVIGSAVQRTVQDPTVALPVVLVVLVLAMAMLRR